MASIKKRKADVDGSVVVPVSKKQKQSLVCSFLNFIYI